MRVDDGAVDAAAAATAQGGVFQVSTRLFLPLSSISFSWMYFVLFLIFSNNPYFDLIVFKQPPTMVQAAPDIPMDALMSDRVDVRSFLLLPLFYSVVAIAFIHFFNLITYFIWFLN